MCSKCITNLNNPLRRDTFKNCGNVTSTYMLFYNTGVAGPLFSPTHNGDSITAYDGLFSYLKNVTNINYMFCGTGTVYFDDYLFYKCASNRDLKINQLAYLFSYDVSDSIRIVDNCNESLTSANVSSKYTYARASKLLRYLPELTGIYSTFNNMQINFDLEEYKSNEITLSFCPLIAYNPKLTQLSGFLYNVKVKGDLRYLFGGHEAFDNATFTTSSGASNKMFPRSLSVINGVIYASSHAGTAAHLPVHNNMFR
jgi:hypothetical protein